MEIYLKFHLISSLQQSFMPTSAYEKGYQGLRDVDGGTRADGTNPSQVLGDGQSGL